MQRGRRRGTVGDRPGATLTSHARRSRGRRYPERVLSANSDYIDASEHCHLLPYFSFTSNRSGNENRSIAAGREDLPLSLFANLRFLHKPSEGYNRTMPT